MSRKGPVLSSKRGKLVDMVGGAGLQDLGELQVSPLPNVCNSKPRIPLANVWRVKKCLKGQSSVLNF